MMEKPDILAWRYRYLRQVRELSVSGRPIVFLCSLHLANEALQQE